jgi:hypothetical protein
MTQRHTLTTLAAELFAYVRPPRRNGFAPIAAQFIPEEVVMRSASRLAAHRNRMQQRQARASRQGLPLTRPVSHFDAQVVVWQRRYTAPVWRMPIERRV